MSLQLSSVAPLLVYRVLTGPTAAGKTDGLVRRAQKTPLAVISADSRQVYCHMDIGTGKVSNSAMDTVPQFGLNLLVPTENYSVYQYFHDVSRWVDNLRAFKGEVWLSGGTGLYIRAVMEGLAMGAAPSLYRPHLEQVIAGHGSTQVATALALELADPANPHRVLRAVEQALADPETAGAIAGYFGVEPGLTESQALPSLKDWTCSYIAVLDPGREELAARIEARVRGMFEGGLVDEASALVRLGYGEADVVRNGIGYKEALAVLGNELNLEQAIEQTIIRTRQYAKRQRTYFRGRGWTFYTEEELPDL
jgi:tRNA dimethylallyltransferase